MFLFSKLIGIATGILSSGTVTSFLYPYLQNSNWVNHIYEKDSSFEKNNFKALEEEADNKLKDLREKFKKFVNATSSAKFLKNVEFQKIQALFQKILKSEEKLTKLLEAITKSFEELLAKNKEFQDASIKKLEEEKQKQLQKKIQESYGALQKALVKWEAHLTNINCFIEKKDQAGEQCKGDESKQSSLVDSLSSFFSSLLKQNKGLEAPPKAEGAQKAQQDLKEIQKSLSQMIQEIQRRSGIYKFGESYAWSKEAIATVKHIFQSELLKTLTLEINKLNESNSTNSEEANKVSNEINVLNKKLKSSYAYFSSLKNQESIFHNWKAKFNEEILKNESDKLREIKLSV